MRVGAVLQCELAAVVFVGLTTEDEADSVALGFRRKDGHEEIGITGETGTVVLNRQAEQGVG